jgi:cell division protein FtsA
MGKRKLNLIRRRQLFESHYTILDIGTEYVKALVVKREENRGVVLGASKIPQKLAAMHAGAVADIQSVIDSCEKALVQAEDMCEVIPGQTVIGIAGEQVRGSSTTGTITRSQPQSRSTKSELATALQGIQRKAMEDAVRDMSAELAVSEVDVKLVHTAISDIQVDGYQVTDPLEFQGRTMTLTVFNTFAPLTHIGALQTVAKALDLELVATPAEPYALARGCATDEIHEMGGIFMDVGGGTTDVALVRGGGVESTRMFSLGGRAFTKRVATDLKVSIEEAEKMKLSYVDGQLPAETRALVHEAVVPVAEILAQGVALILDELAEARELPPFIYIAGGGANLPEVVEQLEAVDWTDQLPFSSAPKITVLTPRDVEDIYDTTGLLTTSQDVTPMGLARYAVLLESEQSDPLNGLVRRVMKAMKV